MRELKLTSHNTRNSLLGVRNAVPIISVTQHNGMVRFNPRTMQVCDLKQGDKVSLAQDQENPEDWYIQLDDPHGFELKFINNSLTQVNKSIGFHCKDVVRKLIETTKLKGEMHTVQMNIDTDPIKQDGITYFAIATKTIKRKKS